jgi:hypothetical protein
MGKGSELGPSTGLEVRALVCVAILGNNHNPPKVHSGQVAGRSIFGQKTDALSHNKETRRATVHSDSPHLQDTLFSLHQTFFSTFYIWVVPANPQLERSETEIVSTTRVGSKSFMETSTRTL